MTISYEAVSRATVEHQAALPLPAVERMKIRSIRLRVAAAAKAGEI
ncbi:MAG: hypothetical protein MUC98_05590 [Desulfobacterota bacterium]|nr:hypothetical protein [Thermodesulfobacteriota bacterium]